MKNLVLSSNGIFNLSNGTAHNNRGEYLRVLTNREIKLSRQENVKITIPNNDLVFEPIHNWKHIATLTESEYESLSFGYEGIVTTYNYIFVNQHNEYKLLQLFDFENSELPFDMLRGNIDSNSKYKTLRNILFQDGTNINIHTSLCSDKDDEYPIESAFYKESRRKEIYNIFADKMQKFFEEFQSEHKEVFDVTSSQYKIKCFFDFVDDTEFENRNSFANKIYNLATTGKRYRR